MGMRSELRAFFKIEFRGQVVTVTSFYFDLRAQKELS